MLIKKVSLFFSSGFNFETLSDSNALNRSENSEKCAQHLSLMTNEFNIRDISAHSDIYNVYDVRISNNNNYMSYLCPI